MRRASRPRRGIVLAYLAPLLFVVFGVAALTIDLATARLTQQQMQSAVDSAALEGLRGRDDEREPDPDLSRRQAASEMVVPTDPIAAATRLGYGPVYTVIDSPLPGAKFSNALQTVTPEVLPATNPPTCHRSYQPSRFDGTTLGLELNQATNDKSGDMVAGSFKANPDYHPNETYRWDEDGSYARRDFIPGASNAASQGDAFLVRMRRSGYRPDRQDGVSSTGPQLPLLLGRGSALEGSDDPTRNYSVRHHGVTVRATAVAQGRPVVAVGSIRPEYPRLAPFVLTRSAWVPSGNSPYIPEGDTPILVDVAGRISAILPGSLLPQPIGFFYLPGIMAGELNQNKFAPIGAVPVRGGLFTPSSSPAYLPLYSSFPTPSGPRDVVIGFGFGYIRQIIDPLNLGVPPIYILTKRGGVIAAGNASASPASIPADPFPDVVDPVRRKELMEQFLVPELRSLRPEGFIPPASDPNDTARRNPAYHLLLAPALVR